MHIHVKPARQIGIFVCTYTELKVGSRCRLCNTLWHTHTAVWCSTISHFMALLRKALKNRQCVKTPFPPQKRICLCLYSEMVNTSCNNVNWTPFGGGRGKGKWNNGFKACVFQTQRIGSDREQLGIYILIGSVYLLWINCNCQVFYHHSIL